jgi:hypothetical protein
MIFLLRTNQFKWISLALFVFSIFPSIIILGFEDPFTLRVNQSASGAVKRFFNVSRVRAGSKDSQKLIKLFDLVNEGVQKLRDEIDDENKRRIANAQPRMIRFKVFQHYKDRIQYLVQTSGSSRLYMLKLNSSKAFADGEVISVDLRLLREGGVTEYYNYFPDKNSMIDGKASVRELIELLPNEENMKIEIPNLVKQIDSFTKKEFLSHLKQGNSYHVVTNDLLDCGSCSGGYRIKKISSLQRERVTCSVCRGKGKVTKKVSFQIVWDPTKADVEGPLRR